MLIRSLLILLLLTLLSNCQDENTLDRRLNTFYGLLNEGQIEKFNRGELSEVSEYLREQLSDNVYSNRFYEIKQEEAVELFTEQDVVEYYYKYFYLKENK